MDIQQLCTMGGLAKSKHPVSLSVPIPASTSANITFQRVNSLPNDVPEVVLK